MNNTQFKIMCMLKAAETRGRWLESIHTNWNIAGIHGDISYQHLVSVMDGLFKMGLITKMKFSRKSKYFITRLGIEEWTREISIRDNEYKFKKLNRNNNNDNIFKFLSK